MSEEVFKLVCPMSVIDVDYDDDDNRTVKLVPCHADLYMDYLTTEPFYWWERDGVPGEMLVGPGGGDDWWTVRCEGGHVILSAADEGGERRDFEPWMIRWLFDGVGVPKMRATDRSQQRWEMVT